MNARVRVREGRDDSEGRKPYPLPTDREGLSAGRKTNQYWSMIGPVLLTKRSSTGHVEQPILVNSATSTGRITPHMRVTLLPVEYDTLATGH